MAMSMNKVFLMGNLTRDPDIRNLPSGEKVVEFGLAMTEQFRNRTTNELKEMTTFVDISVWGRQAEPCGTYLLKGRPVLVEGRLTMDQWTDKEGKNRTRLRVRADRVHFLNPAPKRDAAGGPGQDDSAPRGAQSSSAETYAPIPPPPSGDDEDLPF